MFVCDLGATIRLKSWDDDHPLGFTNEAGAAADPATVTLTVKDPDGDVSSYTYALGTVARDSTGKFFKLLVVTLAGDWFFRWEGTGVVAVAEGQFIVRESLVAEAA